MRYLLFGGEFYYAQGWANDLLDSSNDLHLMLSNAEISQSILIKWVHIYDTHQRKIIAGTEKQAYGAVALNSTDHTIIPRP